MVDKKAIKEFFRPEDNKLIITTIFFLFVIFVSMSMGAPPPMWFKIIELLYYFLILPVVIVTGNLGLLTFVVGFLYWYFVSCIIVVLYRFIRKRYS
ncbi:MAG: hypothetical protein DRP10_02370 [Candidatus Aenigmatarchaeota archaeon]|nr:MAG: hypothetical protein DRP10_02370 [Candidatus Aenigmarchaeota archaeon]